MTLIKCRAKVSANCLDGMPSDRQFGEDLPLTEDGTYVANSDSIVCDSCYTRLMQLTPSGRGLNSELTAAISEAHARGWSRG